MILLIEKCILWGRGKDVWSFFSCAWLKYTFWLMFSVGQGWFEVVSEIVSGLSRKENRDRLLMSVTGTEWSDAGTHAIHIPSHLCILLYSPWYNTSTWCILLFPSRSFQACLSSWEIRSSFALEMLLTFSLVKWIKNICRCWNRRQTMESLIDAAVWSSMLPLSLGLSSNRSLTMLLLNCQHVWVTWRIK